MPSPLVQICGYPTFDRMTIRQETDPGCGPFFRKPEQSKEQVALNVQAAGLLPEGAARIEGVTLARALLKMPTAPLTRSCTLLLRAGGSAAWQDKLREMAGLRQARLELCGVTT